MGLIETLAYAFMRGLMRAYLDVLKERETFEDEKITEDDNVRINNLRKLADAGLFISPDKKNNPIE